MANAFILGAGGHARVVLDALRQSGAAVPVGFLDDRYSQPARIDGLPVVGRIDDIRTLASASSVQFAIAGIGDNHQRQRVVERAQALCPTLEWLTVLHPRSVVAHGVQIGAGSVVMAGAIVNVGTRIGEHCILNTSASIDHDNDLGDFSSVAPGVVTGGNVLLGEGSFLGLGARVIHGKKIGAATVIGAGATVIHDMPENSVCVGTPARKIGSREKSSPYL